MQILKQRITTARQTTNLEEDGLLLLLLLDRELLDDDEDDKLMGNDVGVGNVGWQEPSDKICTVPGLPAHPVGDSTLVTKEEETKPVEHVDKWMRPPAPAPPDPYIEPADGWGKCKPTWSHENKKYHTYKAIRVKLCMTASIKVLLSW